MAKHCATYGVYVPDTANRMNYAVIEFEVFFMAHKLLEALTHLSSVVRVDTQQEFLKFRKRPTRIETQHAEALLRPIPDITRRRIPCPAPRLAHPLGFRQISFAFPKSSFGKQTSQVLLCFTQRAPNSGRHPRQTGLGHEVRRAKF